MFQWKIALKSYNALSFYVELSLTDMVIFRRRRQLDGEKQMIQRNVQLKTELNRLSNAHIVVCRIIKFDSSCNVFDSSI